MEDERCQTKWYREQLQVLNNQIHYLKWDLCEAESKLGIEKAQNRKTAKEYEEMCVSNRFLKLEISTLKRKLE